jgi:hypothetical protein
LALHAKSRAEQIIKQWQSMFALTDHAVARLNNAYDKTAVDKVANSMFVEFCHDVRKALIDCQLGTTSRIREMQLLSSLLGRPYTISPPETLLYIIRPDTARALLDPEYKDENHVAVDQLFQTLLYHAPKDDQPKILLDLITLRERIIRKSFESNSSLLTSGSRTSLQGLGLSRCLRIFCITNELEFGCAVEADSNPLTQAHLINSQNHLQFGSAVDIDSCPSTHIPWLDGDDFLHLTPVHIAVTMRQTKHLEKFITKKQYGELTKAYLDLIPIHFAAAQGDVGCLVILSAQRSWNQQCVRKDSLGRIAISYAAMHGHLTSLKILAVAHGQEFFSQDYSGRTPISFASENGHLDIVEFINEYLTSEGLNPRHNFMLTDKQGLSATDYARRKGYTKIVDYLEKVIIWQG